MAATLAVLLVEDNPEDACLIERQLRGGGFDVAVERVEAAAAMREALGRQHWDVIICDHNLPGFSAPEALTLLKETDIDIPFIIVSGTIEMGVAVDAMRAGAQDFIEKDNLARLNPAIEREVREARERARRRAAEAEVRAAGAREAFILNQLPIVLWTADKQLTITSYNGSAVRGINLAPQDRVGLKVADNIGLSPQEKKMSLDVCRGALRGRPGRYEAQARGRLWESHITPMRDEQGDVVGVIGISYDVTEDRQKDEALHASEQQLRYLSHRLLVAHEEERKRIARDIHDSVGQSLAAIKIRTQNVMNRIETNAPRTPATSLEAVLPVIQQTIDEVRRMQVNLHPAVLDDFGVVAAIKSFVKGWRTTYPLLKVTTKLDVNEEEIPKALRPAIFRVVQESMNNIAKHSGGDTACVCLSVKNHKLTLQVSDNGRGFDMSKTAPASIRKGALGLVSMRERVQLSGGEWYITSDPGVGTKVKASWPVGS